jgi:hypothetical protein
MKEYKVHIEKVSRVKGPNSTINPFCFYDLVFFYKHQQESRISKAFLEDKKFSHLIRQKEKSMTFSSISLEH